MSKDTVVISRNVKREPLAGKVTMILRPPYIYPHPINISLDIIPPENSVNFATSRRDFLTSDWQFAELLVPHFGSTGK
jgi:hypothetical protein